MPRPPKPRGVLRVAVRYTPANQLGGDVYDFYRLENNRLGILVADVSGPRRQLGDALGDGQGAGRAAVDRPCSSRASCWPGWTSRASSIFPKATSAPVFT